MAEVKFVLYSDPDFMLVKSIRMQVFMNEQNIKGEEEFDELDKEFMLMLKTMPLIFTKSLDFAFAALNLLIEE